MTNFIDLTTVPNELGRGEHKPERDWHIEEWVAVACLILWTLFGLLVTNHYA
jgi:hypothetical protein